MRMTREKRAVHSCQGRPSHRPLQNVLLQLERAGRTCPSRPWAPGEEADADHVEARHQGQHLKPLKLRLNQSPRRKEAYPETPEISILLINPGVQAQN